MGTSLNYKVNLSLMVDSSLYETASKKKFELDEAMPRCLEHSGSYLKSVPDKADYKERWVEARNKYSELRKRDCL